MNIWQAGSNKNLQQCFPLLTFVLLSCAPAPGPAQSSLSSAQTEGSGQAAMVSSPPPAGLATAPAEAGRPPADGGRPAPDAPPPPELMAGKDLTKNIIQAHLANRKDIYLLKGEVVVPSYTGGLLQLDAFPVGVDRSQQGPLTSVQLKGPGVFELRLPQTLGAVELFAVLDVESNGPDKTDVTQALANNPLPLSLDKPIIEGLRIELTPPDPNKRTSVRPPWEQANIAGAK